LIELICKCIVKDVQLSNTPIPLLIQRIQQKNSKYLWRITITFNEENEENVGLCEDCEEREVEIDCEDCGKLLCFKCAYLNDGIQCEGCIGRYEN